MFVSSSMQELKDERAAIRDLAASLNYGGIQFHAWVFEDDAPADHRSIQQVYLDALKESNLYIGVFWNRYGEWTIDEFNYATEWGIDRHVYVKDVAAHQRDPRLVDFLAQQGNVTSGITSKWFRTLSELRMALEVSIDKWVGIRLRQAAVSEAILASKPEHILRRADEYIGHVGVLEEVRRLVAARAQVVLQGFSGTGKSALAAEIAAWYLTTQPQKTVVWLKAGKRSSSELLVALAQIFGQGRSFGAHSEDHNILELQQMLENASVGLVVLDDAQNGSALAQAQKAIPPTTALLVTSQQRHAMLPHLLELMPLYPAHEPGAAVAMLRHYSGMESIREDDADTKRLLELLDYLPFGLRIAGYRLRRTKMRVSQLLNSLEKSPLELELDTEEEGRRSLKALLVNATDDLDSTARRVLEAFGVLSAPHATSALLETYLRIAQPQQPVTVVAVEEALGTLVEHGLADTDPESPIPFYTLPSLAYRFVRDMQTPQQRAAMIQACVAYAREHTEQLDALSIEMENLLGAAQAAADSDGDALVELLRTLSDRSGWFEARGYPAGAAELMQRAATYVDSTHTPDMEHVFNLYGKLGNYYTDYLSDLDKALTAYQRALEAARALQDPHREAVVLAVMGDRLARKKDDHRARQHLDAAEQIATQHQDEGALGRVYEGRAAMHYYQGDYAAAAAMFQRELEIAERLNRFQSRCNALNNLASQENLLARHDDAKRHYALLLALATQHSNRIFMACAEEGLGETCRHLGDTVAARDHYTRALEHFRQANAIQDIRVVTEILAEIE